MPEEAFLYLKMTNDYFAIKANQENFVGFIETEFDCGYTYNGKNYFCIFESYLNKASYVIEMVEQLYEGKYGPTGLSGTVYEAVPIDVGLRAVMLSKDRVLLDVDKEVVWVIK